MKYTEFTGKTVEEAVEEGLKTLGLTEDQADIRVLEEGKKKLFGSVKARVEIAAKGCEACDCACESENDSEEAPVAVKTGEKTDGERTVEFLEGLFKILKITACTELVSEGEKVEINVTAANTNAVIGKRGVMLDAIQTLAGAVANTGRDKYKRVVVDCENYRENREATLNKLAENLAQKAIRLGKKVKLEPMNPYERRIIHSALSEREGVKTESEGKEPNRYIVVIPDNLEDPTAEAIPARTERRNDHGRGSSRGGYGNRGGRGGSRGFGNRSGGYKKFNRDGASSGSSGGTSLKKDHDFFGIFLGNSGNSGEEE
ncbi:MAG: protein jag [Clostridia bacterium]|nr:protein jag [Clostridia bacterium]